MNTKLLNKIGFCIFSIYTLTFLSGCTTVLQSHSDVMSSYATKDEVKNRLGLPSEKREDGSYSEWIYSYGQSIRGVSSNLYGNNTRITNYTQNDKYIKFVFNGNYMTKWESNGVDLGVKKTDIKNTVILTALGLGLVIVAASEGAY
jgi:hypothetical protein